jgi:hypothetical protein
MPSTGGLKENTNYMGLSKLLDFSFQIMYGISYVMLGTIIH